MLRKSENRVVGDNTMMLVKNYFINTETPLLQTRLSKSWDRAPVRNVFVDTTLENTTRLRINLRLQRMMPTIRQLYSMFRVSMSEENILAILKRYTETDEVIDVIGKLKILDLRKLASLIIWLTYVLELKVTGIGLVENLETGQPQFIGIYIEDCDWDEWKILSKIVKKRLVNEGFDDIAGRVALICKQALRIRKG